MTDSKLSHYTTCSFFGKRLDLISYDHICLASHFAQWKMFGKSCNTSGHHHHVLIGAVLHIRQFQQSWAAVTKICCDLLPMFGELLADATDLFGTRPIEIHDALSTLERLNLHMDGFFVPDVTQNKSQVSNRHVVATSASCQTGNSHVFVLILFINFTQHYSTSPQWRRFVFTLVLCPFFWFFGYLLHIPATFMIREREET